MSHNEIVYIFNSLGIKMCELVTGQYLYSSVRHDVVSVTQTRTSRDRNRLIDIGLNEQLQTVLKTITFCFLMLRYKYFHLKRICYNISFQMYFRPYPFMVVDIPD